MDRHEVSSTNLASVGWEPDTDGGTSGTLEVEFNSGQVYQYADVPEWIFKGLLYAPSPGKFLRANIVDAFEGNRIE